MSDDPTDPIPSLEQLEKEIEISAFQASGPGGQHRNRTYSAIRMTHKPTGITVTASDSRSQATNRKVALRRLHCRIVEHFRTDAPRVPTRKSGRVRSRERADREHQTRRKRQRRSVDQEGE